MKKLKGEKTSTDRLILVFLGAATAALIITIIGSQFETILTEAIRK